MAIPAIHLLTVGEPRHAYARLGTKEYLGRLGRYARVRVTRIRDSRRPGDAGRREEGEALVARAGRAFVVALDPGGTSLDTPGLARLLADLATRGEPEAAFLVGGPDGLSDLVRSRARLVWSLSALTFPHDLAQLVLCEALYRAATVERGEPYHR